MVIRGAHKNRIKSDFSFDIILPNDYYSIELVTRIGFCYVHIILLLLVSGLSFMRLHFLLFCLFSHFLSMYI